MEMEIERDLENVQARFRQAGDRCAHGTSISSVLTLLCSG